MNRNKALALAGALALVALLLASTTSTSRSGGIMKSDGLTDAGCICHGPNAASDGVPNPNVRLLFEVDGNPYVYAPGQVYNLSVGIAETDVPATADTNQGGFNLRVNVGELGIAPGFETFIKLETLTKHEATHTAEGDKNGRVYNLTWKAPTAITEGPAIFTLFANSVNGDASNNVEDHWNGGVFVIKNEPAAAIGAGHAVNPEEFGVNWLAHWVGITSFLAVIGVLLVYYFVLKYGESIHTTDHRDRKEK